MSRRVLRCDKRWWSLDRLRHWHRRGAVRGFGTLLRNASSDGIERERRDHEAKISTSWLGGVQGERDVRKTYHGSLGWALGASFPY